MTCFKPVKLFVNEPLSRPFRAVGGLVPTPRPPSPSLRACCSGPNTKGKSLPPPLPRLRELSVVTEISAWRVLSLHRDYRGNHVFTPFSLPTNKDVYYITSPALLPISFIWYSVINATVNTVGETKRHLSDRFGEHRRAIEDAITQQHIDQPTAVSDHFELITSNRDVIRKAKEAFLISKNKTLETTAWRNLIFFLSIWFSARFIFSLYLSTNHVISIS